MEGLKNALNSIQEFLKRWWALLAAGVLVIFYSIFTGRGDKIAELQAKIELLQLERKLIKLEEEAKKDDEAFKGKLDEYNDLKRRHSEITERLRLGS